MNVLSNIDYSKVISVFCDRSRPETHLSGYMGGLSDDEMILKHISKDGFYDGFILIHLSKRSMSIGNKFIPLSENMRAYIYRCFASARHKT